MTLKKCFVTAVFISVLSVLVFAACGEDDGVTVEDGQLKGQGTVPLVPIDLPMYPTDVTLEGMAESAQNEIENLLEEYNLDWLIDTPTKSVINTAFDKIEVALQDASLEILQPGVLSVSVDNQVTEVVRDYLKVTNIGVIYEITNDTESFVSVPVEFQLFMGDGDLAEAWDESVMIPFEDPRVDTDGNFIVEPGETVSLSIDNVPQLVDALNNSTKLGVGYKSLYRVGDILDDHEAVQQFLDKFLFCILKKIGGSMGDLLDLLPSSYGDCPTAEELISWHLTINKFSLVIEAESDFDIPEIPYCSEFAQELELDLLEQACPPESSDSLN